MDYIAYEGAALSGTCLAMGDFDGLHKGHRAVLDKLLRVGAESGLAPVLLSFDRDEAKLGPRRLTTEAEKRLLLEKSGLKAMVSLKTESLDAAALMRQAVERLGAKVLVVGENDSRLEQLKEGANACGCGLVTCGVVEENGEEVTSQRAARALEACDFPLLLSLLGHPYFIYGEVVYGKQLGRTVGMPTANISYASNKHLPPDGVYGTITMVEGAPYKGMANVGRRPTVDRFDYVTVENFLLDFSRNLYGKFLRMDLHALIRGVMRFNSLEEVKAQVEKDIQSVRSSLEQSLRDYYTLA